MMMSRKSKGLGERHQKILDFLRTYQQENQYPPSIREIGEATGISSTSVVNYYLDQLEKLNMIERDRKISRGVRLANVPLGDMLRLPVLGRIVASAPAPMPTGSDFNMYDSDTTIDIARSLLPTREKQDDLFALEVQGDSMIDAMVNDGDIIVMKPAVQANNGDMVAVWLPETNSTTLKYFFKEKDGYRLQPANPTMEAIRIPKDQTVEIRGKVVMVIRKVERERPS